jgi:hypothetical protein
MRITSVKEAEQKVSSGGEPDMKSGVKLSTALNWYSYYKDPKDSKKYLIHYMTVHNHPKEDIVTLTGLKETHFSNVGFVCRLTERGLVLEKHQLTWLSDRIKFLLNVAKTIKEQDEEDDNKPKVNIQERIHEQSSEFIGELEGFLDNYKETINTYEWMATNGVKAPHARLIVSHFIPKLVEPVLVLSGKASEDLTEAYSCFTKANIKKFVAFIQQIIDDANRIVNNSKVTRKPRKSKKPSADKLIAKMQYKKEDIEYKVVSVNPIEIIGAQQLWVFNTKTRKLGVYNAESPNSLTVKGTSIYAYEPNTSSSKTLRKPNDVLQDLVKATERKYKSTFEGINSTKQELTGRINADTILLKIFK